MNHTITIKTDVEVKVDLSRFPLDALKEELESRYSDEARRLRVKLEAKRRDMMDEANASDEEWTRIPALQSGTHHPLHSVYYAMKFGKPEHALDLMRDFLNDQFGVAL